MNRGFLIAAAVVVACATASRQDPSGDAPGDSRAATAIDSAIDGNNCATQPCDILTQCGCGTTMACDIDGSDNVGTACRSVATQGHETSACSGPSGCDRGYVCLGGTGQASCHKYCTADAECGTPRGQCVFDITSNGVPIAGIPTTCSSNCDPLTSAATYCPSGEKCAVYTATHNGSDHDVTDCSAAGAGTQGTSCKVGSNGDDTLCAANFMCTTVDSGTTFQCRKVCNKGANTGCTGSLTCLAFNPALTIGGTQYGVCN